MSIVTEALNRLQAERSPKTVSPSPESSSPVVSIFSRRHHKPVVIGLPVPRQVLRGLALLMILGLIGLGAYLWGLRMVPTPPEVFLPPVEEPLHEGVASPPAPAEPQDRIDVTVESVPQATEGAKTSPAAQPASEKSAILNRELEPKRLAPLQSTRKVEGTKPGSIVPRKSDMPANPPSVASHQPASTPSKPLAVDPKQVEPSSISPLRPSTRTEAVPEARPLVPSGNTVLEKRLSLVKQLINRKRYGQAMTLLQPMFVAPPERWELWFWRGTAYLGLGQLDQAEESFMEGLARNSTIPHLWVQRALVSQQRGHFDQAVESLRQAELLAPELPEVQLNLGYSLEIRGDPHLAVEHYQTFLALTEGNRAYQSARKKVFGRILQLRSIGRNP